MDQSTCADEEGVVRVNVPNYTMYARRAKVVAIVIGLLATLNTASTFAQAPGQLDTPAPDFRAHTLGPQPVARTLADYRGKVVLLAVWATWCSGCRDEMASMQRMFASYAARGFRVVAVSIDRGSDAEISAFAQSLGLTFDIVRDDGDILTTYLSRGVPTTFLIDRRGIIRRRNFAAVDWDVEPRLGQIRKLIDEPEPPAPTHNSPSGSLVYRGDRGETRSRRDPDITFKILSRLPRLNGNKSGVMAEAVASELFAACFIVGVGEAGETLSLTRAAVADSGSPLPHAGPYNWIRKKTD